MRKLLLVLALVALPYSVQANDSDWTEVTATVFDQIDGNFAPRLSGGIINYMNGKGIGAFLGNDNAIGPTLSWRVWALDLGGPRASLFTVASTNVANAMEAGVFSNGTFGVEPRFWIPEFGNAEIAIGILSTTFVEGEKAEWTPYAKLCFRP